MSRKYHNTDEKQVCLPFPPFREKIQRDLKLFSLDLEADQIANITGLSRNTINKYCKAFRKNGSDAMDTFANLHLLKDKSKRDEIRKDLLAYCRLDTLAMVRIWERLKVLVDERTMV